MQIKRDWKSALWHSVAQGFFGGIALALVTMACFSLGLDLATTAFAYLIVIVLLSLMGSFYVSAVLSIIAVAALNYFFAPPIFNFRVDQAQDSVLVIAFLLTSVIVTGLVRKARSQTEAALEAETVQREQASLLNLTHDSIFVRDMNDVITYWNHAAEEFYGWTAEDVVGKRVTTHQLLKTVFPAPLDKIDAELLSTGRWEGELVHTKADGTQVVVTSRWSLLRDERQRPLTVLETNNDVTNRKQAEEALRQAQADVAHFSRVTTMGESD
jgi:PAS domain S-box-containing protein